MQLAVVLFDVFNSTKKCWVFEEIAILDLFRDLGKILEHYSACADIGVANFAVAHLAIRQTYVHAAGAQQGDAGEEDEVRSIYDFEEYISSDEFLKPYLTQSADNRLKNIVATIQEEQNKIIRLPIFKNCIIQGPPGTGKTMTASVLASELQLPLYVIQLDKIVTKFMGETSAKLRLVFEGMRDRKGVYLFDEFDTIGGERAKDNDVGEMRRVLNSFLQFIENDPSDSLIVCATNNPKLLDQALFRRFDDILRYELPDVDSAKKLIRNQLVNFISGKFSFAKV